MSSPGARITSAHARRYERGEPRRSGGRQRREGLLLVEVSCVVGKLSGLEFKYVCRRKNAEQRDNILRELLTTEREYCRDLKLLFQVS